MDPAQLKYLVEALVFAADKPLTIERLRQLTRISDVVRLEQALTDIAADYKDRGIALQVVSGGYQFRTNTQYSVWVQQLIAGRPVRLSRAQLETLAIVAYRQPITRPEIDEIRGVDSSATLRLLLDRSLIRTLGKKEDVGRPMLYGTTRDFLDFFSLNDLRELPTLREYSELTAESRKVMSDRLGVDVDEEEKILSKAVLDDEVLDATATQTEPFEDTDGSEGSEGEVSASASTDTVVRDGVEYDRWGQPLGPVGDEDSTATDDEDLGAASGSSFEERANLDLLGVEGREVPDELAEASDALDASDAGDASETEAAPSGEAEDAIHASAESDSDTPDRDDESLPE
jgi:segregation and condensation protein B